jgi:hypothetical protein
MSLAPFGWQDNSTETPFDAAEVEAFGQHIGAYVDAQIAAVTALIGSGSGGQTTFPSTLDGGSPSSIATLIFDGGSPSSLPTTVIDGGTV